MVMNAAARMMTGYDKYEHITPSVLRDVIHWLSVPAFKIAFNCIRIFLCTDPHNTRTSAYRRRICLAEPVSVLWNVEIWRHVAVRYVMRTSAELGN